MSRFIATTLLCCFILKFTDGIIPFVQIPIKELNVKTFTHSDASNYKTLHLINEILYIGGTGLLFSQNASDISTALRFPIEWRALGRDKNKCSPLPQSDNGRRCFNFIQTVQPFNSSHLFLCGSMALHPRNVLLDINTQLVMDKDVPSSPYCSSNPSEATISSVAVSGVSFSTILGVSSPLNVKAKLVESLPTFGSLETNNNMIGQSPRFVSSFHADDVVAGQTMKKIYIVFEEKVQEGSISDQGLVATRIAQVCANDAGGFKNYFTTFLKASLVCKTNEVTPFIFDKVTGTVLNGDILYATFTTQSEKFQLSALCVYRLSDIQQVFHSREFYGVQDANNIPSNPSPGDCADRNGGANATSKNFFGESVPFVIIHPLISKQVLPFHPLSTESSTRNSPVLLMNGEYLTQVAVQKVKDLNGRNHTIVFVGSKSGKIFKFLSISKRKGTAENKYLAEYELGGEVNELILSPGSNLIYVRTPSNVMQMSTGNCDAYLKPCSFCDQCLMCLLARDPMCAWSSANKRCVDITAVNNVVSTTDMLQDVVNGNASLCGKLKKQEKRLRVPSSGQFVSLGEAVTSSKLTVRWFKASQEIQIINDANYRINDMRQLEILRFRPQDEDSYTASYAVDGFEIAKTSFVFTANSPTTNESNEIPPPPPTPESATSLNVAVAILAFFLCLMIIFIVYLKRKKLTSLLCPKKIKKEKKEELGRKTDEVEMNVHHPRDIDSQSSTNQSNNSNNVMIVNENPSDEKQPLLSADPVPQEHGTPRKIAKVLPYSDKKNNETSITDTTQHFHSKNVFIRIPKLNSQYSCRSVKQDKGILSAEFALPDGINVLFDDVGSSVDPPLHSSSLSDDLDRHEESTEADKVFIEIDFSDPTPLHHSDPDKTKELENNPLNTDPKADGDSPLKGSIEDPSHNINLPLSDINAKSTAEDPPSVASNVDQTVPDEDSTNLQSKVPAHTSPSPVGSFVSRSSNEQYKTPPATPLKQSGEWKY